MIATIDPAKLLANATPGNWHTDGRMISANSAVSLALLCEFDSFGGIHDAPNAEGNGRLLAAAPALARHLITAAVIISDLLEEVGATADFAGVGYASELIARAEAWLAEQRP